MTQREANDTPQIIAIYGDPCEGFSYVGPFKDFDEANDFVDEHLHNQYWWTKELTNPNVFLEL